MRDFRDPFGVFVSVVETVLPDESTRSALPRLPSGRRRDVRRFERKPTNNPFRRPTRGVRATTVAYDVARFVRVPSSGKLQNGPDAITRADRKK